MGATTVEETELERKARQDAEQAELDNDNGAELEAEQAAGDGKDGQAHAKRVDAPPEELLVGGTIPIDSLGGMGGKKATGSTITIQGCGSIPVMAGQAFDKGQYVRFEGVALVEESRHKDKVDRKAGVAVDSKYAFFAYATDVRVFGGEGPRLPDDAGLAERVASAIELLSQGSPDVETALELLSSEG